MQQIELLEKRWREFGRRRQTYAQMSLEKDGLVLGTSTLLAKRNDDGALALDSNETRILTLLSVAYERPVDRSILGTMRSASKHARIGNEPLAAMHIALAKLPPLSDPIDAARRIFIADGLIDTGVDPHDIWTALEFDPTELDAVEKGYDPNELRNPKGEGAISGRWTSIAEATEAVVDDVASGARRVASGALRWASPIASAANVIVTITGQAGTSTQRRDVPGHPDLEYALNEDMLSLAIYRPPYPIPIIQGHFGANSTFMDRRGRKIARLMNTGLRFYERALSESISEANTLQICPKPSPDRPGGRRELDLDYEDFIKEQNNKPPTPRGYAYWLLNPVDKRPVVIDDCRRSDNTPVEAKRGYHKMTSSFWGRMTTGINWGYQATRQTQAWGGPTIEWDFSDKQAATWGRFVFSKLPWLRGRIRVEWKPWMKSDAGP